ncbi:MAG: hypothetical protein KatS3mg105_1868 [Gemmatales bacterium]|nr:MAG: hypothetical protein KatS3mg105_1868 [Gemmatales bacterium]
MSRPSRDSVHLVERLCRRQRVGVFGHRGVGKTTLLAMLYREAVAGRIPGIRIASADPATSEYLGDKITQLESGNRLPATLAEADLNLNLYQGSTRLELTFRDYQGEHVELGRDESIHEFLNDCDALWLCIDVDREASAARLLRRQQEFEQLLERYVSEAAARTIEQPVALILTKADRLQSAGAADGGENVAAFGERMNMTFHTLRTHCPNSDLFAISSLGREGERLLQHTPETPQQCLLPGPATTTETPNRQVVVSEAEEAVGGQEPLPVELSPKGLAEPIEWLVASLQRQDEARLETLFEQAPTQYRLLRRSVECFADRYPGAEKTAEYRQLLRSLRRRQLRHRLVLALTTAIVACLSLWSYDALGYQNVLRAQQENADDPVAALEAWRAFQRWHPTRHWLTPGNAKDEVACIARLQEEKNQKDKLLALEQLRQATENPDADPDHLYARLVEFHATFPNATQQETQSLRDAIVKRRQERRTRRAQEAFAALLRTEEAGTASLETLLSKADQYLREFPDSVNALDVQRRRKTYIRRIEAREFEKAQLYSKQNPLNFQTRIEHYQAYLDKFPSGGIYTKDALKAIADIEETWDKFDFRAVRDHFVSRPAEVVELAARCRTYLAAHPQGRFVKAARDLLRWTEQVSERRGYRVVLKNGEFEKSVARFFSRGPDLSVVIEVNGIRYGPSTISEDSLQPEWEFEFPRPIRWKLGDRVRIIVTDYDWLDRVVFDVESEPADPLAILMLSRAVYSGNNWVRFQSDFTMPKLPRID